MQISIIKAILNISSNKNILLKQAMNQANNQNINTLEQKYQAYKATQMRNSVLLPLDTNLNQESDENDSFAKLLQTNNNNQQIYEVMLTDNSICSLSQNLKKEAELKNKEILISTFPTRYKQLLDIQLHYKAIIKRENQKQTLQTKKTKELKEVIQTKELQNMELCRKIKELNQQIIQNDEIYRSELNDQARKKDQQILSLKYSMQDMEKKIQKLKNDYRRSNQMVVQLRDQQYENERQMQRLIDKLKEVQQKLVKSQKKLLGFENDKHKQIQGLTCEYQGKLKQVKERQQHLVQLLEQANIRNQYKQSLLKLCEQQNEKVLSSIEEENMKKMEQSQKLREQLLNALKTIDELQLKVNILQEKYTNQYQIWQKQRSVLKKQLQKSRQESASFKVEIDGKSQFIRILQKSVQCLQITFDTDFTTKNNEFNEVKQNLTKCQARVKQLEQKLDQMNKSQIKSKQLFDSLRQQNTQLLNDNKILLQKIELSQKICTQNIQKISSQQQMCNSLKWKVKQWLICQQNPQVSNDSNECGKLMRKLFQYESLIQKMKQQIIMLTHSARQNATGKNRIVKDLIQQNKELKRKLQQL